MEAKRMLTHAQYYKMNAYEFKPEDAVAVKIVASVGYGEQWAAYVGESDWTDERVLSDGDKIRQKAAEALFPTIAAQFTWRS